MASIKKIQLYPYKYGWGIAEIGLILALPIIFFKINSNIFFLNAIDSAIDPWGYLGYFINLKEAISHSIGGYPSSRLGLSLLGGLIYSLFKPQLANIIIRLILYYGCSFSLYIILRILIQNRWIPLTIVIIFCSQPVIWYCLGRDYTDGGCILYSLLSMIAMVFSSRFVKYGNIFLFTSGIFMGLMISTHLFSLALIPVLISFMIYVKKINIIPSTSKQILFSICFLSFGVGFSLLAIAIASHLLGGHFLYLSNSINFATLYSKFNTNPWKSQCEFRINDYWVPLIFGSGVLSVVTCFQSFPKIKLNADLWTEIKPCFLRLNYILALLIFLFFEFQSNCIFMSYSPLLLPFAFLAIAESIHSLEGKTPFFTYKAIISLSILQAFLLLLVTSRLTYNIDVFEIQKEIDLIHWLGLISPAFAISLLILVAILRRRIKKYNKYINMIYLLSFVVLIALINFNFQGYISSEIYSNQERYKTFYDVTNYLKRNKSLVNSYFWYNAKSPAGDFYRSIAATSFMSGNLIGENYPFPSGSSNELLDEGGSLNPQSAVNPGDRIVVFNDIDNQEIDSNQSVIHAVNQLGIEADLLDWASYSVGEYKFQVFILEARIFAEHTDQQIFSCSEKPIPFLASSRRCTLSLSPDQENSYLLTTTIPVKQHQNYLISTDIHIPRGSIAIYGHIPGDEVAYIQNSNYYLNTFYDTKSPNAPIFKKIICPDRKSQNNNRQIIFNSGLATQIKLYAFTNFSCDFSSLERSNDPLRFLKFKIYELDGSPNPIPEEIVDRLSVSQNLSRDWWRVRYPQVLVDKIDFNASEQAFEVLTNKSYEDYQFVYPNIALMPNHDYSFNFSSKISVGGLSALVIDAKNERVLTKMSLCKSDSPASEARNILRFRSPPSKQVKLVFANHSTCSSKSPVQSHFFLSNASLYRLSNRSSRVEN